MAPLRLAFAILGLAAAPIASAIPEPTGLARQLRAGADEEVVFVLSGNGVNLFQCKARINEPNAYSWFFVAPEVTLYEGTRAAGRHTAVGQFDWDNDRTSVVGMLRATQPAGPDNLPWAAMRAVPTGAGGMFAGATTIQRVNTVGGVAPAAGCGAANVGGETRVNYSADFYFYRRRGTT